MNRGQQHVLGQGYAGGALSIFLAREFCREMGWQLSVQSGTLGTISTIELTPMQPAATSQVRLCSQTAAERVAQEEQKQRVELELAGVFGRLH